MPETGEVQPQIDALANKVQARREEARAAKNPDIATDKQPTREDISVPRSPTTRLIRGSLAATLKDIKHSPEMNMSLLPGFVAESRIMADSLDKLDVQFHKNGRFIETGDGSAEKDTIYGVELDLNKPQEGVEDTRIPYVMIGGTTSTSEQNAALSMALALEGNKVIVLTYPEQMREQTGGRGFKDKISNIGTENIEKFKNAVKSLGLKQVNLIGHSFGGAAVIEMAADSAFTQEVGVHDVISLAPSSFERRHVLGIGTDFNNQGKLTQADPEANVMMMDQGDVDAHRKSGIKAGAGGISGMTNDVLSFFSGGRAAATKMIDAEKIATKTVPNISGRLEVWTGSDDTVCRPEPVQDVLTKAVLKNPMIKDKVFSYRVDGARHDSFITNALGLVGAIKQERDAQQDVAPESRIGMKMSLDTLKRSGAEVILEKMKRQAIPRAPTTQ